MQSHDGPVDVILFGLSEGNVTRLKEGKPILIDGREVGLGVGVRVVIAYGQTEEALTEELTAYGFEGLLGGGTGS